MTACREAHIRAEAEKSCISLMESLDREKRLDFEKPSEASDPRLSAEPLFGEARGQMFGILLCREQITLKAFSGQYNGIWQIEGWVPPVLSPNGFEELVKPVDKLIKLLSAEITSLKENQARRSELTAERRELSKNLMTDIHKLYEFSNFKGEKADLLTLFRELPGIPAGTGDCCAPKLLNCAANLGFTPLAMAEFYWGRENRSGTRRHRHFYRPCRSKCGPLLKFMLRGAENLVY